MPARTFSPLAVLVWTAVVVVFGLALAVQPGRGDGDDRVAAGRPTSTSTSLSLSRSIVTAVSRVMGTLPTAPPTAAVDTTADAPTRARATAEAAPSGGGEVTGPTSGASSATSPPQLGTTATSLPPTSVPIDDTDLAAQIAGFHNRERSARGLGPLQRSSCLDAVARGWAQRLAISGSLSHNPASPTLTTACLAWEDIGENVGFDGSLEALGAAWMASTTHVANILNPAFDRIGVGVVRRDGLLWVVVDFAG